MIRDTRRQDGTGMAITQLLVQGKGAHGWQVYDPNNDNGVDGMIILRKNTDVLKSSCNGKTIKKTKERADTGDLIFVQVKCGTGNGYYKETQNRPAHFGVLVGQDYLQNHIQRWDRLPGPIIMVYVDYISHKAWWTDLRATDSYSDENKSIVLFNKSQRFGKHSFGEIKKRLISSSKLKETPSLLVSKESSILSLKSKESVYELAKKFYIEWSNSNVSERTHPELGEIIISRVGWRHLIKKKRTQNRIINSLLHIKVAKEIILRTPKCFQLKNEHPTTDIYGNTVYIDFLAIRRNIIMPNKQSFIVQVVLKRKRKISKIDNSIKSKVWFYSIYEPLSNK